MKKISKLCLKIKDFGIDLNQPDHCYYAPKTEAAYRAKHNIRPINFKLDDSVEHLEMPLINPATGLPLLGGTGGVNAVGNLYGQSEDIHQSFSNTNDEW